MLTLCNFQTTLYKSLMKNCLLL